jgi:hypothetical protein
MKKTFAKTNDKKAKESTKKKFDVLVVIRHTRAGDQRIAVIDNRGQASIRYALDRAEEVADEAARDYGFGSTSVFKATLTLIGEALPSDFLTTPSKATSGTHTSRELKLGKTPA